MTSQSAKQTFVIHCPISQEERQSDNEIWLVHRI